MGIEITGAVILDVIIVLGILLRALSGSRQGLMVEWAGVIGSILGAIAGFFIGPAVLAALPHQVRLLSTLVLSVVIIACITLGWKLVRMLAKIVRGDDRAHGIDAFLGGMVTLVVSTVLVWGLISVVRPVAPPALASAIDESKAYGVMQAAVPQTYHALPAQAMEAMLTTIPHVFDGQEPSLPISPPDTDSLTTPGVARASRSVVRVMVSAPACSADKTGSGWVVSPERIITNAHVVAGSSQVKVDTSIGVFPATVVAFDDQMDVAVLAVPGMDLAPLLRRSEIEDGADAIAAGYPWGGPYTNEPARIRGRIDAHGSDIYGQPGVVRDVYAVRGSVVPGNSGGPLLASDGGVVGTVFARSARDADTGYAMTNDALAPWIEGAADFHEPVEVGHCVI